MDGWILLGKTNYGLVYVLRAVNLGGDSSVISQGRHLLGGSRHPSHLFVQPAEAEGEMGNGKWEMGTGTCTYLHPKRREGKQSQEAPGNTASQTPKTSGCKRWVRLGWLARVWSCLVCLPLDPSCSPPLRSPPGSYTCIYYLLRTWQLILLYPFSPHTTPPPPPPPPLSPLHLFITIQLGQSSCSRPLPFIH